MLERRSVMHASEQSDNLEVRNRERGSWLIAAGSLLVFVVIAVLVNLQLTSSIDASVLTLFRDAHGDARGPLWLRESLVEYTALGGYPIIVLAIVLSVAGLFFSGKHRAAGFLFLSVSGGALLSSLMKLLFERPRPGLVGHLDQIYTSSFPSAHAMVSMLAWLTLALVISRFISNIVLRRYLLSVAVFLSLLIGATRVYLGVHWPSDVIAGWSLGLAWANGSWLCAHYLTRNKQKIGEFGTSS